MGKKALRTTCAGLVISVLFGMLFSSAASKSMININVLGSSSAIEIKIPVYERGNQDQDPAEDSYWSKWIQKKALKDINVKVTYVPIPRMKNIDKFNVMLSAGQAPDIIFSYDYSTMVAFHGRGAFQEIPQSLINTYASNYVRTVGKNTLSLGQVGRKQYYMTAKRPLTYNFVSIVRQDWLDKLKLKQPETVDEYYKVLKAFKEKDPGNIGKENIIPVAYTLNSITSPSLIETWFRNTVNDNSLNNALYSDITVGALSWDAVKQGLKFTNKLYNEKLLSPEFMFDRTGQQYVNDVSSGRVGYWGMYMSANPPILQTLKKNVPSVKLSVANPINLVRNKMAPGRSDYKFGMISGIYKNTSKQGVIAVLKFLNWLSKDENLHVLQNGIEGKNYSKSADEIKPNTVYTGEERLLNGTNKDYWCLVTESIDLGSDYKNLQANVKMRSVPGFEYLIYDVYKQAQNLKPVSDKVVRPDFMFDRTIESLTKYQKTLSQKYEEATVKLTICKTSEFEALYKKLVKDYLASGYQKILDEKKKVYLDMTKSKK